MDILSVLNKGIAYNFKLIEIMQYQIKVFTQNQNNYGKDNDK